jgi:prepilin-type N-terminal cleavage/methylation domain-containing protein
MHTATQHRARALGSRSSRGFTLVELLVVMSVIAILVAILLPTVIVVRGTAKRTATKDLLYQINAAIQTYSQEWGNAPPDDMPSDAKYIRFTEYDPSNYTKIFITDAAAMAASAESLAYHLMNENLTGQAYLELQAEVQRTGKLDPSTGGYSGDYQPQNKLPEIIDSWGRPFLYNRAGNAYGDPIHNPPDSAVPFDLYSVGADGITSNDIDPLPHQRTAVDSFNDQALSGGYGYGDDDISNW